ncbi:MAG: glycosyl hydrolase [Porcipelethomonas sp.]
MFKTLKRTLSALTASALAATMAGMTPFVSAEEESAVKVPVGSTVEAEDLTLNDGITVWTDIYGQEFPGYSGSGFVYMTGGSVSFEVDVEEDGMYEISTSYIQILDTDSRRQSIEVNGSEYGVFFPHADKWTDMSFGKFRLNKGTNLIKLTMNYGYAGYDTITVKAAEFPELNISPELSDENATAEAKGLMTYLCDVYGEHILSGQQEIYGGGHTADSPCGYSGDELLGYESEFEWIKRNFGVYPAIRGFDFMNYNPLYGWDDGSAERAVEWGKKGGIPTICWHINIPVDFENYTVGDTLSWEDCTYKPNSSFSVANATTEGTKEYEYVMETIRLLAEQLQKLQDENIPVIFRPYHEAEGNSGVGNAWFWWGQEGAEPYVALWRQLYTELTETYGLHNLIWEFNSYNYSTSAPWYPGDEWVDIVGFDKYNTTYNRHDGKTSGPNEDAISSTFYDLVDLTGNKKLVSMPENDTVPSLGNILTEKAYWLYFCIWYDNGTDNFLSGDNYNDPETLKEMYQSDYCITLDELPGDWANYTSAGDDTPDYPDLDFTPGDLNDDGKVNIFDTVIMERTVLAKLGTDGLPAPHASADDVDGDGIGSSLDDLILHRKYLLGYDVTFKVYEEPTN